MAKIVSLGSALQDIFLIDRDDFATTNINGHSVFHHLEIGSKEDVDKIRYFVGGGGTNSAAAFARYGHEAFFVGNIANDAAGEAVLGCLDHEGINNTYVGYSTHQHTGCSVVLLDAVSGERTILTYRGASDHFHNFDPAILDTIQPDWLYITTMGGDLDTLERFLVKAAPTNIRIMWNPGVRELKSPERVLDLLQYIDILIVNKTEAAALVPGTILTELLAHLRSYVNTVIITDGPMGAIAQTGDEAYRLGIYETVTIQDTTGAGDAFGAGFLASFAKHNSFYDALIFGAANSTAVIQEFGAKAGLLSREPEYHSMPIQKL